MLTTPSFFARDKPKKFAREADPTSSYGGIVSWGNLQPRIPPYLVGRKYRARNEGLWVGT